MTRPNQQPGPADDQPWYFKYGVRFLGITGAFCKYYQTVWKIQRSLLFAMFGSIFCVPFLFGGRFFDFVVYMSIWRMFVARVCMPSLLAWSLIINLRSCCIAAWFFGGQTLKTKQWFVCPPCKMNRFGIEWGISMCVCACEWADGCPLSSNVWNVWLLGLVRFKALLSLLGYFLRSLCYVFIPLCCTPVWWLTLIHRERERESVPPHPPFSINILSFPVYVCIWMFFSLIRTVVATTLVIWYPCLTESQLEYGLLQ